mmetsp:Transcript_11583/g.18860  ORF Transcript_11583/g.18860 Transcript_11583/m.18860 type:complete len:255 (-) Transcript_11583:295-1059(-)
MHCSMTFRASVLQRTSPKRALIQLLAFEFTTTVVRLRFQDTLVSARNTLPPPHPLQAQLHLPLLRVSPLLQAVSLGWHPLPSVSCPPALKDQTIVGWDVVSERAAATRHALISSAVAMLAPSVATHSVSTARLGLSSAATIPTALASRAQQAPHAADTTAAHKGSSAEGLPIKHAAPSLGVATSAVTQAKSVWEEHALRHLRSSSQLSGWFQTALKEVQTADMAAALRHAAEIWINLNFNSVATMALSAVTANA